MSTRDLAIYCLRRMGGNDTLLYVLCNSSTKTHPLICFFLLFLFSLLFILFLWWFWICYILRTLLHFLPCFDMQISLSDIERHLQRKSSLFLFFIWYGGIDGKKIGWMDIALARTVMGNALSDRELCV